MSAWTMARRSLWRRKLRTGLTVLSVVVGIAMMFLLLSLTAGVDVQVHQLIRAMGGADLTVSNATAPAMPRRQQYLVLGFLNESLAENLTAVPGVYNVTPQLVSYMSIDDMRSPTTIIGIDPATHLEVTGGLNIALDGGRSLQAGDREKIVLGKTLADTLNKTVNAEVTVITLAQGNLTFTVVGVFESEIPQMEHAGYVTLEEAQEVTNQTGLVTQFLVKCVDPNLVETVAEDIRNSVPGVRVANPAVMAQRASQMLNTLTLFFLSVSLAALVAGCFGVVNTMLMSVVERTREIGMLKAIGARDSTILRIFLIEALLIGVLGGAIGICAGGALAIALPYLIRELAQLGLVIRFPGRLGGLPMVIPAITPNNTVLCFAVGALIGVAAGVYPAWRAARMSPLEALRRV